MTCEILSRSCYLLSGCSIGCEPRGCPLLAASCAYHKQLQAGSGFQRWRSFTGQLHGDAVFLVQHLSHITSTHGAWLPLCPLIGHMRSVAWGSNGSANSCQDFRLHASWHKYSPADVRHLCQFDRSSSRDKGSTAG